MSRYYDEVLITTALFCTFLWVINYVDGYEVKMSPSKKDMEGLPILLWWDNFGERPDYINSCSSDVKCRVTFDLQELHADPIMMYIFYGSSFLTDGLPFPRQDGDLWALVHEESPKNSDWIFTFPSTLEIFNYTATFKRESHYPFPTHWLSGAHALTEKKYLVPVSEKNRLRKEEGLAPILFVHSDCTTPSNREGYMEKLMKHVDVDSYGSCLHNKDFPEGQADKLGMGAYISKDFYAFTARYKFTMAFENAICDDYITEKLWRPLAAGSVPIVMGSSKVQDFLPSERSAILISEFDSVQDLAAYIKHLDAHDDEYETYLEFKDTGITNPTLTSELARMTLNPGENQNFMTAVYGFECYLCEKLYEAKKAVETGEEIPQSQALSSHLDCPLPRYKYDEDGKLVIHENKKRELEHYRVNAKVFREFYDRGENVNATDLYDYTVKVQKGQLSLRDEL